MVLTAKDKRALRAAGTYLKPEVWIGKQGISIGIIHSRENSFRTKELVKIKILDNCAQDRREIAEFLSLKMKAEIVQILGNVILLYKPLSEMDR